MVPKKAVGAKALEDLEQERELLNTILSSLNTGLSLINPDLTIEWVNEKTKAMFPGGALGKVCYEFYESREKPCEPCATIPAFDRGDTVAVERFNAAQGQWYQVVAQPIKDASGKVVQVLEGITNVTERKRAEQNLKESEERYRVLFEQSIDAICITARDGKVVDFNQAALRLFGYTRDEMLRTNIRDMYAHPDDRVKVREEIERKGFVKEYPMTFRKKDGTEIHCLLDTTLRKDADDTVTGYQGLIRDMTSQKKTEKALFESERKHRTLFESSRDALMIIDGTRFVDCNKATLDVFGCGSKEEFLSKHPAELSPPQQPGGNESFPAANGHMETAFSEGSDFFEWMHRRVDGSDFPAEVLLSRLAIEDTVLLQAVVRDISMRKEAEDNLKKAKSAIESAKLQLERANRELEKLSTTDGLTGVANRRHFDEVLSKEWRRALRKKEPLCALFVDVDHFKDFNDHYGHAAGDDCLKKVAETLRTVARRPGDLAARYGGEEFVVLYPETDATHIPLLAERLRGNVVSLEIPHGASPISDYVTVSIGVAAVTPAEGLSPSNLVEAADKALYKAKRDGRNRVVVFGKN